MHKTLSEYFSAAKDEVAEFCNRCMKTHRGPCAAAALSLTFLVGIPFAQAAKDGTPQPTLEWTFPTSAGMATTNLEIAVQDTIQDGVSHGGPSPLVWYTVVISPGELTWPLTEGRLAAPADKPKG